MKELRTRYVIQQQIPQKNSLFSDPESRWINILWCQDLADANVHYLKAKAMEDNWPSRMVQVTETLVYDD